MVVEPAVNAAEKYPPKMTCPVEVTARAHGSSSALEPETRAQLLEGDAALRATKTSLPPYVAVALQPPLLIVPPNVPAR